MDDLTDQERAILIAYRLAIGQTLTIARVVELTGLSRSAAYRLMIHVERMMPVYCDCGSWKILEPLQKSRV